MAKSNKPQPKSVVVTKLLAREKGASIAEIVKATGWKDHSVRAFLSGIRKKQTLTKEERSDGVTAYRLIIADAPKSASAKAKDAGIAQTSA